MIIILSLIGLLYMIGLGTLFIASHRAPEGFEDESGFRYGTEQRPVKVVLWKRSGQIESRPAQKETRGKVELHAA